MSLARDLSGEPASRQAAAPVARDVIMGRDANILADVHAPGIAAAIWSRTPDAGFQAWLDALPARHLPELRTVIPFDVAEEAVQAACEAAGTPVGPERDMLAGDVGALALIAARVLDARQLRVRLDVARGVMCPRFHLDAVRARLLCTYRGPGTEYVPEGQEAEGRRVRRLRSGAAALFRGSLWPGMETTGLLHRSPAPEEGSGARLLLVIDPEG